MPKVTGLSNQEMKTLDDALDPLVHEWLEIFDRHVANKAERVAFRVVESGLNMAEHLSPEKKLGALVDGSNKLLPKLEKYLNDDALEMVIPAELKTPQIADLCDKAGAAPLAKLLHESFSAAAAPAFAASSAPAVAATPIPAVAAVVSAANPTAALVDGFQNFRDKYYENGSRLMEKLAKDGASPDFFIINCIDSRSGADLVFDAKPGQQFIDSQMAAIVPPYDRNDEYEISASLHYAVDIIKIKHLVIMGHAHCGGCAALVEKTSDPYLAPWVAVAKEAGEKAEAKIGTRDQEALRRETERQVVIMSLRNVLEYPVVKKAFSEGRLTVNGWYFDMDHGTLHEYDPEKDSFRQLNTIPPSKQQQPQRPSGMSP